MSLLGGKRILLTRAAEDNEAWAAELRAHGAHALSHPCIRCESIEEARPVLAGAFERATWIAFTSRRAARALAELLEAPIATNGKRLACVGAATRETVEALLGPVEVTAPAGTGESLADILLKNVPRDELLLLPTAEEGRDAIERAFAADGRGVRRIAVYRTIDAAPETAPPPADAIFFASPSAVRSYARAVAPPPGALLVSLGPATSDAIRELGWKPAAEAPTRDLDGLIRAAVKAWSPDTANSQES